MALKQTRRSISFQRELYGLVNEVAEARGQSASQFVSEVIRREVAAAGKTLPVQHFAGRPRAEVTGG